MRRWVLFAIGATGCGRVTDSLRDAAQDAPAPPDTSTAPDATPMPTLGYETDDFGDDPYSEGCVEEYASSDLMCASNVLASYGETCEDAFTLIETLDMACDPFPLTTMKYDCRVELADPQAFCVEVQDFCHPGNPKTGTRSAYCDAPFDAGSDGGPNDGGDGG